MTAVKDAAHAVRILEALVEQGENMHLGSSDGPWALLHTPQDEANPEAGMLETHINNAKGETIGYFGEWNNEIDSRLAAIAPSLVPALVEGAKAVLRSCGKVPEFGPMNEAYNSGKEIGLLALAGACAPRMAEAGMEVPE